MRIVRQRLVARKDRSSNKTEQEQSTGHWAVFYR